MKHSNEKPLSPTSWPADGEQGSAAIWGHSLEKATQLPPSVRLLMAWHIDAARALILGYAETTDEPEWEAVEAADSLECAAEALAASERNALVGNE